jgi:DNA-binding YbaB/EbfC family protein
MVIVKANGHKEIIDIQIKEEAVDPDDVEMLQDLLVTALNDAIKKADELSNKEMSQVQKGMQLPPGFGF